MTFVRLERIKNPYPEQVFINSEMGRGIVIRVRHDWHSYTQIDSKAAKATETQDASKCNLKDLET